MYEEREREKAEQRERFREQVGRGREKELDSFCTTGNICLNERCACLDYKKGKANSLKIVGEEDLFLFDVGLYWFGYISVHEGMSQARAKEAFVFLV